MTEHGRPPRRRRGPRADGPGHRAPLRRAAAPTCRSYDVDAAADRELGLEKIRADSPGLAVHAAATLAEAVAIADLFVEAIVERADAKAALLARSGPRARGPRHRLQHLVAQHRRDRRGLRRSRQVVGMHFFNPAREDAPGRGDQRAADARPTWCHARSSGRPTSGRPPIVCADSPNFVVNRVCRPLYYEAQLLATQGVPPAVVDSVARGALGHRMGPLELLDFVGLHTHLGSSETAHRELGTRATARSPRRAPSSAPARRAGRREGLVRLRDRTARRRARGGRLGAARA